MEKWCYVQRSELGGDCRLRNPWDATEVAMFRDGQKAENASTSLLKFNTRKGERIVLVQPGKTPEQFKRTMPAQARWQGVIGISLR